MKKLSILKTTGYANNVVLSHDSTKAYISDSYGGLVILDISDPANPTKLGSYKLTHSKSRIINWQVNHVTLSKDGTKAYLACEDYTLDQAGMFVILDISDPANITEISSYCTKEKLNSVTLSSDNTKAYLAYRRSGLVIVDISDPANPTKLGSYCKTTTHVKNVTLSKDGTKAYMICKNYLEYNESGLVILDISDPANPTKLGSYQTGLVDNGIAVSDDGTKAYVAGGEGCSSLCDENGLVILDISDSANPTKIGMSKTRYNKKASAQDVTLSSDGKKAYVADFNNGLCVIDISNPTNPKSIEYIKTSGYAKNVTLSSDGTVAYVAGSNGLVVVDIKNKEI